MAASPKPRGEECVWGMLAVEAEGEDSVIIGNSMERSNS